VTEYWGDSSLVAVPRWGASALDLLTQGIDLLAQFLLRLLLDRHRHQPIVAPSIALVMPSSLRRRASDSPYKASVVLSGHRSRTAFCLGAFWCGVACGGPAGYVRREGVALSLFGVHTRNPRTLIHSPEQHER
jgi:hypothetical protein